MSDTCGERSASCVCDEPEGHEPPHHCTRDDCGGQWTGTHGTSDFEAIRLPQEDEYPLGSLSALFRFGSF